MREEKQPQNEHLTEVSAFYLCFFFYFRLGPCRKESAFMATCLCWFSSLSPCAVLAACHEKRGPHEAPGKSVKTPGNKMCPYSHPSSQNTNGSSAGNSLSTSADLCKTTSKHYKTMCRRPTPPGNTTNFCNTNVNLSHFMFFFIFISIMTVFLTVHLIIFF